VQRQGLCEQDHHAYVSVESSTSSDEQLRRPDVHKNSVDRTVLPADDWQQNADVVLMQSHKLERSEQPGTEEQYHCISTVRRRYSPGTRKGLVRCVSAVLEPHLSPDKTYIMAPHVMSAPDRCC